MGSEKGKEPDQTSGSRLGPLTRGDYERAAGLSEEAIALARDTGDAVAGIFASGMDALVAVEQGDPAGT